MKRTYSPERMLLVITGAVGCVLSLADLFGILDVPLFQQNVPKVTLAISATILTVVAGAGLTRLQQAERRLQDLSDRLDARFSRLDVQLTESTARADSSVIDRLPDLIDEVDPALLRTFRPYLEEVFRTPPRVLKEKKFRLENLEAYRSYHRRTLEENPGATFLATSLPYRKWFWRSDYLERAMSAFTQSGGSIVRIFFVAGEEEVASSSEVQEVLSSQTKSGVTVYTLDASRVQPDLRRFFFVEDNGTFAWEAVRGPDDQVASIEVTADRHTTRAFLQRFEQLRRVATPYLPGRYPSQQIAASEGSILVNVAKDPAAFREFEYLGWQGAVERYHAAWSELTSQTAKSMLEVLEVGGGTRILDVASGPGYIAAAAAARGAAAVAVDFSPSMVAKGRELNPEIEFHQGDAQQLPFDNDAFDAVAMNFGMLHLGEPERAIAEAFRVLRHGGRFAFTVWTKPADAKGFSLILKAVEECGGHVTIPHGPDFFYYSRPEECKVALTTVGFAAANVMLLDLEWHLESAADVFPSFFEGTARTGGLLRQQGLEARREIEQHVSRAAQQFAATNGNQIVIPMPAVLAFGTKH